MHETVLCDDRDSSWFNNKIKFLIRKKKTVFKRFRIDRSNICLNSIAASKQKYYCRMTNKLINAEKSSKA